MSAALEPTSVATQPSLRAEENVLGWLLARPGDHWLDVDLLHVHSPQHRIIFGAITALRAKGEPHTADEIVAHLKLSGALHAAGGEDYVKRLANETIATPESIPAYVARLKAVPAAPAAAPGTAEADAEVCPPTAGSNGRQRKSGSTLEPWPDPVNVFAELGAPPFQATDAPPELADYPRLYAECTGIDLSIMLVSAVAAAAAAIPDQIQVCGAASSRWFAQPRLWALVIGAPGAGKSPGQREMLSPLWKLHSDLDNSWRESIRSLTDEDPRPPRPRVIVGDTTLEALSEVLSDNPRGALVATDEFDAWLGGLDQYKSGGIGRDRGEWLRLFDGGPHSVERVKRGTVFVPNWGCSILTATTPAAMARLTRHLPEDGLLQRFIVVLARRQKLLGEAPIPADIEAEATRYNETIRRLWSLAPRAHNGVVSLSAAAAERFTAWRFQNQGLQEALGSLDPALEGHIAKYPTLALRLALTFHCARIVHLTDVRARDPASYPIPVETLDIALAFLHRASQHAQAIYLGRRGGSPAFEVARATARYIVARTAQDNAQGVQRRDVLRHVLAFRNADDGVQASAMRLLADLAWVREVDGGYQKAQPTRYAVNPEIANRFGALAERERARRAAVRERIADAVEQRRADAGAA